ncbi:MAG: hypothetical protein ACXAEF_14550 [Candidatus Thorarchaeota archaeon]|jgi:hypothetical protein
MKKVMRKMGVGLLSFVLLLVLVSASPVEAKVPLRWEYSMVYQGGILWEGDIYTADGMHGHFTWILTDYVLHSNGQLVSFNWRIDWDDGSYIEGYMDGISVYETHGSGLDGFSYVSNGEVTDTSLEWSGLNGCNIHTDGNTCPWPWIAEGVFQIN